MFNIYIQCIFRIANQVHFLAIKFISCRFRFSYFRFDMPQKNKHLHDKDYKKDAWFKAVQCSNNFMYAIVTFHAV